MTWTTHYFDRRLNRDSVSRAFASKEDALRQARDLMRQNCVVRFIEARMMKKSTLSRSLRGARVVRRAKIPRLQSSSEACAPSADFIIDIAELVFGTLECGMITDQANAEDS